MSGVGKLAIGALIAGFLVAVLMLPYAAAMAWTSTKAVASVDAVDDVDLSGDLPERTTMVDINGKPLAYFFNQNRVYKPLNDISLYLQRAVVSMEDRRFFDHEGWDWRSTARAVVTGKGGASTLTQQYVKNYLLLVTATTDAERAEATAITPIRKLREAKMAIDLEAKENKDWVLERYLNIVGFGTRTYGAEAAAEYYFSVPASRLNLPQAALLAGMLQNPTGYNPLNPATVDAAQGRRNVVIDAMVRQGFVSEQAGEDAKNTPIGNTLKRSDTANGCFSAENAAENGYYCQYVLDYLANRPTNPLTLAQVESGGYTIRTNFDPQAMKDAKDSVDANASPDDDNATRVANVIAIVEPGANSRKVIALAANRPYGDDQDAGQTLQRLTTTFAPLGAGSVFKIFTAASALEKGLGTDSVLKVDKSYPSRLNPGTRPITNSGPYPSQMELRDALARSPNTPFVALEEDIGLRDVADMAVKLGLRGYDLPAGDVERSFTDLTGTYADQVVDQKMVSFTLGVTPVSPVELSNVGATLASSGMWCPPSPVASLTTRTGADVELSTLPCEQVVEPKLADTLADALLGDVRDAKGTAHQAFQDMGWDGRPVAGKTGTTQNYKSSAFLGFTPRYSAAVMVWDYQSGPRSICKDPKDDDSLASCSNKAAQAGAGVGGGYTAARTWAQAIKALSDQVGAPPDPFPVPDPTYVSGSDKATVPNVVGMSLADAKAALAAKGFQVPDEGGVTYIGASVPANQVISQDPTGSAFPGSNVTLRVSQGNNAIPGGTPGSGAGTDPTGGVQTSTPALPGG